MTSNELLYVKTVADEQSITKAAKKLHIAQPSLSQCIQKIEREFQEPILVRTAAGVYLTEFGKEYYKMASTILEIYDKFLDDAKASHQKGSGKLRIGASWYLCTYFLPIKIREYCREYPYVDVMLTEKRSAELEDMFQKGLLDLIFIHQIPWENREMQKLKVLQFLGSENICMVASPDLHLEKYAVRTDDYKYSVVDLNCISEIPIVKFLDNQKIGQIVSHVLKQAGINPPTFLHTYGFHNALDFALNGKAITFLPEHFVEDQIPRKYHADVFCVDKKYNFYWDTYVMYWSQPAYSHLIDKFICLLNQ